jgi:hypothetical protein
VFAVLEALVKALSTDPVGHHLAQGLHIDAFGSEVLHFVLLGAEDRVDPGVSHPRELRAKSNHEWRLRLHEMPASAFPGAALIMPTRLMGWHDCSMQFADALFKNGER